MKLLLITQVVDTKDTFLSFMHSWIATFAPKYESVTVICLKEGEHNLPANVRVLSLGKESGQSRIKYVRNFYRYIFAERRSYDAVFVHMNQEYVLLGGLFWKLWGKRVYMWRNHHAGSLLTDIAAAWCTKIFCTSKFSYTARFAKTTLMPIGIDTEKFRSDRAKAKNSVLFLARIAPVKKPHLLIEALAAVRIPFAASIYGDALPKDREYAASLPKKASELGIGDKVSFYPGVPNDQTVDVYGAHDITVNLSSSGMYDKTIFEAMACGSLSVSSNENLKGEADARLLFREGDATDLSARLSALMSLSDEEKDALRERCREYVVRRHSLVSLRDRLFDIMSQP